MKALILDPQTTRKFDPDPPNGEFRRGGVGFERHMDGAEFNDGGLPIERVECVYDEITQGRFTRVSPVHTERLTLSVRREELEQEKRLGGVALWESDYHDPDGALLMGPLERAAAEASNGAKYVAFEVVYASGKTPYGTQGKTGTIRKFRADEHRFDQLEEAIARSTALDTDYFAFLGRDRQTAIGGPNRKTDEGFDHNCTIVCAIDLVKKNGEREFVFNDIPPYEYAAHGCPSTWRRLRKGRTLFGHPLPLSKISK